MSGNFSPIFHLYGGKVSPGLHSCFETSNWEILGWQALYSVNKYEKKKKVMLMLDILFLVKKYNLFINASSMYSVYVLRVFSVWNITENKAVYNSC